MTDLEGLTTFLRKHLPSLEYEVKLEKPNGIDDGIIVVYKSDLPWCLITKKRYSSLHLSLHTLSLIREYREFHYWAFQDETEYDIIDREILSSSDALPRDPNRRLVIARERIVDKKQLLNYLQQTPLSLKAKIIAEFQNAVNNYNYQHNKLKPIVDNITENNVECKDGVVTIDEDIENQLFKYLIGQYEEREVCRYTSLNSLFQSLSNHTFRMYGLAGMNDKEERAFLQNAIYQGGIGLIYQQLIKNQASNMPDAKYIMSCTSIKKLDLLEMWRLYADDATGVCLVFEKFITDPEFKLIPIRYDRCSDVKKDWTPQFKFIMDITKYLGDRGLLLLFHKFEDWKICIKSGEYNYEKEVRLVYNPKDKTTHNAQQWVLTNTNSIANPYVEFALTQAKADSAKIHLFPLKLKKIILGPKCPEAEVNKEQIEMLLALDPELNKMNIKVEVSEIHNYR